MKKKIGKPVLKSAEAEPVRRMNIFMKESEFLLIRANATTAAMSFSAYVRHITLGKKVNACLSEEDKALFREIVGMSNDLHQLWKMAREQGVEQAMAYFEAGRNAVDKIINKLNHDR